MKNKRINRNQSNIISNSSEIQTIEDTPIWHKITLSFKEAALLTGIGENRLRALADRRPELVICIDSKRRIKRKKLEEWIDNSSFI